MRATSWTRAVSSDERRPTAGEVTRARFQVAAMVAVLALLGVLGMFVAGSSSSPPSGASTLAGHSGPAPAWGERLGRLDEAIEMRSVSRAVYEWREAYGEALRSRNWTALVAVGDRGARMDGLLPRSGRFWEEARHAYVVALFRARSERSAAGILAAADSFQRLGDVQVASAAHRMLAELPTAR